MADGESSVGACLRSQLHLPIAAVYIKRAEPVGPGDVVKGVVDMWQQVGVFPNYFVEEGRRRVVHPGRVSPVSPVSCWTRLVRLQFLSLATKMFVNSSSSFRSWCLWNIHSSAGKYHRQWLRRGFPPIWQGPMQRTYSIDVVAPLVGSDSVESLWLNLSSLPAAWNALAPARRSRLAPYTSTIGPRHSGRPVYL